MTPHQQLLHSVPTISAAQLTAMSEPDAGNVLGSGAVASVHRLMLASGDVACKQFRADVGQAGGAARGPTRCGSCGTPTSCSC